MNLTISQYLSNPHGKGAATMGLKTVRAEYDSRYEALLNAHGNEFETKVYSNKSEYYVHLKIPSETKQGIVYDIIIKILPGKTQESSILNSDVQVMCNSPSFVFTYAYVYKRERLLIKELDFILPKKSLQDAPTTRNPYKVLGLEKTLYYACRYLKENFPTRDDLVDLANPFNVKDVKLDTHTFEEIMSMINLFDKKESAAKKKAREEEKAERNKIVRETKQEIKVSQTANTFSSGVSAVAKRATKSKISRKAKRH